MSTPEPWQENNAQRLTAALAELRERLTRAAQRSVNPPPPATTPPAPPVKSAPPVKTAPAPATPATPAAPTLSRSLFQKLLRPPVPAETSTPPPAATADETVPPTATQTAAPADANVPVAAVAEPPSLPAKMPWALDILADRFGLSGFEQNVLLLCAATELDTRIAGLCARAQDDPQKPFPTFALALALFDDPSWEALAPDRPLRYLRLVEVHQPGAQALTASALRPDERIVNYLKGLNHLDERLAQFFSPWEFSYRSATLSPTQEKQVEAILRAGTQAAAAGPRPAVQLVGADSVSKQLVALHVATNLEQRLYRVNAEMLPGSLAELDTLVRLWQRESALLPLALYFDAEELGGSDMERSGPLSRFLSRCQGVFFVGVREFNPRLGRAPQAVDIAKPAATEQQAAWAAALGTEAGGAPAQLAAQFNLNLPVIESLAGQAQTEAKANARPLEATAWDLCRASERPRLDTLAQRLEPKMTWDDLVLPKAETELLRQISAQVAQRNKVYHEWGFDRKMNRGFGISALFAGESGTGKTMAAEVIANELRLNLYRIDLSQVVNKYIGETEKNLRRLFDAAEDSGAILFFDEADALFGKRSTVKDSHDRYANIEINYLLQRIESYRGLAVLATNVKSALDPAFIRRLRFIVDFHFPAVQERRRLWGKAFMQHEAGQGLAVPAIDRLDYDRLATLNLTGGHIHNVALNAAFLAAHRGTTITMPLVLEAARAELRKLERPINELELKWTEPAAATPVPPKKEIPVTA